jgi:quinol monooxygenase YgiN
MPYITVATPPMRSIAQFDEVMDRLGEPPAGLRERHVGTTADGTLRIVSVWESKQAADRFLASDRLGAAVAQVLGPEPTGTPDVLGVDVERSFVGEPVG